MAIEINESTVNSYRANLEVQMNLHASLYDTVPRWGNYVGNGPNDAWNKADAALKTWPSLAPGYAAAGAFPRTGAGAAQASRVLRAVMEAEAHAGKAGAGDPLHVGFGGDPEQAADFDHDFEHGAAAAAHDLRGEIAANSKFAGCSLHNVASAALRGNAVAYVRDADAAIFIGEGESDIDIAGAGASSRRPPQPN